MKRSFIALMAVAVVAAAVLASEAAFLASEAVAQERAARKPSGAYRPERPSRTDDRQRSAPQRGQSDPNSYDGRRTGQPRTCGHDFFLYDDQGTPMGPYCN